MINLLLWYFPLIIIILILIFFIRKRNIELKKRTYVLLFISFGIISLFPIVMDFVKRDFPVSYFEDTIINNAIVDANELENVCELITGNDVEQTFVCDKNTVAYISLYMFTYERNNLGTISIELIDNTDSQVIDTWDIDVLEIVGNSYLTLEVNDPFAYDLYGHECLIKVTSDITDPYKAVTIKKQKREYDTTELKVAGVKQEGNLIFKVVGYGRHISKEWTRIALAIMILILVELVFYYNCRRKHV